VTNSRYCFIFIEVIKMLPISLVLRCGMNSAISAISHNSVLFCWHVRMYVCVLLFSFCANILQFC